MFQIFKKFFVFAGDHKNKQFKSIFFSFLHSLFESLKILAIAVVLNTLINNNVTGRTALTAFLIMLVSIIGTIITWEVSHISEMDGSFMMCGDKRIQIGDRMKYMPMGYFDKNSLGEITAVVTTTMAEVEGTAPRVMGKTIGGFIHAFIIAIAMTVLDWRIGLIVVVGIILFTIVNSVMQKKSQLVSPRRQKAQTTLVDAVLEYVQGMSVVKAFNLDKIANKTIDNAIDDCEANNYNLEKVFIPYIALQQLVLRLASAVIILASIVFYLSGTMALATTVLMIISSFIIYSQLESAGSMSSLLRLMDTSIDNVEAINHTPMMQSDGDIKNPNSLDIAFENISFSYGNKKIIDGISFAIPEGSTTAIVGPSGGGKSTLCNLIARFWDVDEGAITLGRENIKNYSLDNLLSNISMVFQNVYLFNDTIANNIKFGKPDATEEEIILASKKACCHSFVKALPNGYNTVVGESGATISGGEKQRISIARAILKDAPIIILDEATANVDPENESNLQDAISELTKNKTIIMIAHRLKTVRNADQIIVIDNGKISQKGTHDELINSEGIYCDFVSVREQAIGWKIKGQAV